MSPIQYNTIQYNTINAIQRNEWKGTVQNLLYNGAGANTFLKSKQGSVPPKKLGKNVETPQTVIVKKVLTPLSER